ncbi:MAG: hypothetical protein JXN60_06165 [Lentisphaerae bacterium]|nr:hypothetical protein [Lentisphaerota bacterium]
MNNEMRIVCFGAGVGSTSMTIELVRRKVPFDAVVFADTGCELPETLETVGVLDKWLKAKGLPGVTIVRNPKETLEEHCLRLHALPSFAYGGRRCTDHFKLRPMHKWIKSQPQAQATWRAGKRVIRYVGFDIEESERAKRSARAVLKMYDEQYPLIRWGVMRWEAQEICKTQGWDVNKSSCWCCPAMKKREVFELSQKHPGLLLARALTIERNANLRTIKGLGRSWNWSDFLLKGKN